MWDCGFKSLIAIGVFIAAICIRKAPDGYPAAVLRAWLFDMLPFTVQDAYVGFTPANMIRLACATYEWIKAAAVQLSFRISVIADLGSAFLKFFGATIYSWSLCQKLCVDTAVVWASGVMNAAKTLLIELLDTSVQLHSRLEVRYSSTLAHCVDGFLAFAVLLLLLTISAVVITALRSVVKNLCIAAGRVHWRGILLLFIAWVFGYVGYLWKKAV